MCGLRRAHRHVTVAAVDLRVRQGLAGGLEHPWDLAFLPDGQVLVTHDLLGIYEGEQKKIAKRYAELGRQAREAIAQYAAEVRSREFPTRENSFVMKDDVLDKLY